MITKNTLSSLAKNNVNTNEIMSSGVSIFFSNWVATIVKLLTTLAIVRLSGAEAKGVQVYVVAYSAIASIILGFGLSASVSYSMNSGLITSSNLMRRIIIHFFVVTLLLLIFSPWLISFVPPLNSTSISETSIGLWVIATCPVLMLNDLLNTMAVASGRIRNYSLQINSESIVFGLTSALFALFGNLNSQTVLISCFMGYIAGASIGWFGLRRFFNTTDSVGAVQQPIRSMYRFALQGFPSILINGIQRRVEVVVIGPLLGVTQLAYYSVGAQGFQVLMSIPRALTGLLTRSICRAHKNDAPALALAVTKKLIASMSAIAILASLTGYVAVPFVYGGEFKAAVAPFALLVWAAVFSGGSACLQTLCTGQGRPGLVSVNVLATALIKILLLMILVTSFGIVGCAVATLVSAICGLLLQWWQNQRLTAPDITPV